MVDQRSPSGLSRPATGLPLSLTMVTAASTPSAAVTDTGASTVTPTAPSVTDAVSLGTTRSANGVPLSAMTLIGAGPRPLPHATAPIITAVIISAVNQALRTLVLPA